ncbi:MAG: metal-dependent transcriptional regulator [Clostridia bacterium]
MENNDGFYTLKGYSLNESERLTSSMEDYLEMICRILQDNDVVRISELAEHLHVKPSSASKMVNNLKEAGYIEFKKYGYIAITGKGVEMGNYLLHRHKVLNNFLCLLNHSENELEQVEKIEHFIDKTTVDNLERLTERMRSAEALRETERP